MSRLIRDTYEYYYFHASFSETGDFRANCTAAHQRAGTAFSGGAGGAFRGDRRTEQGGKQI